MHKPMAMSWWFTKFHRKLKSRRKCQNLCYPAVVAREGISLCISEKENLVYWFITSTVVRSPLPLITLLWVAVCPRHNQRNFPYSPTIRQARTLSSFVAFRGRFVLFHPSSCLVPFSINWIKFQGKCIPVRLEPTKMTCPVPGVKHIPWVLLTLCSDEMYWCFWG